MTPIRLVLPLLLAALPALAGEGLTCGVRWEEDAEGVRVVAEGTAEAPDGGVLDVALEFEGAAVARTEAEVGSGAFRAVIRLGDWGHAGHYHVSVRYDPISQDRVPVRPPGGPAERALSGRFPLDRGTYQEAAAARAMAATAMGGVAAITRDSIARARRAALDPDPDASVARETEGIEAGLRAAQAQAWPYLPMSSGAVDRLRGWARGRPEGGRAETLSAWFAIGERLATALDRALSHEREGRRPEPENAPRPVSSEAPDTLIAARAAQAETTDEAIDALGPTLARMGRAGVERLGLRLGFDPVVARRAVRCLGWIPHEAAVEALRPLAAAGDPGVRAEALRSLGRLGDRASAAAIQKALADPVAAVRVAAVDAIVLLGGEDRAPVLFPLAADPDAEVASRAREAVRRLAGDWPADLPEDAAEGAPAALREWWLERSGQP